MNDFSFIRLEPTLERAIYTRNSPFASIIQNDMIQLATNETYLQKTNYPDGIAFAGNYTVHICDCEGVELQNITPNVAIYEYIDSSGTPQIAFEIVNIGTDYYKKPVLLKFNHTVSDFVWFSNLLIISNYELNKTTRFDYLTYLDGRADFYQSIRLACYFTTNNMESSSKQYTSIDGIVSTSRLILTEFENYKFDKINNFTYRRINRMFANSVVYVNGYRNTNKVTIESNELAGDTNYFSIDFALAVNYSESYNAVSQIFEEFELIDKAPFQFISLSELPEMITGTFNRNITLGVGQVKIFKDGLFLVNLDVTNIVNASFEANLLGAITENGNYKVVLPFGLFVSDQNERKYFEWSFELADGEYDNTEYNNQYLIN